MDAYKLIIKRAAEILPPNLIFEYNQTKSLYVILSGENCNAICVVELLRVERSE